MELEKFADSVIAEKIAANMRSSESDQSSVDVTSDVLPEPAVSFDTHESMRRPQMHSDGTSTALYTGHDALRAARRAQRDKEYDEMKKDIDNSKNVVKSMFNRVNEKHDPGERFISFDALPEPLQRVITAYTEYDAAVQALKVNK